MPAVNKGLTSAFNLRASASEWGMVGAVIEEYEEFGVKISRNDGVRILMRRGAERRPANLTEARILIAAHWAACSRCDEAEIRCPEGRRLKVMHDRLWPAPAPAPVPAPVRPADAAAPRFVPGFNV
jgi:hypothetical protein